MGILTFPIKRVFLLWSSPLCVVQLPTHLLKAEAYAALWYLRAPSHSPLPRPSCVSTSIHCDHRGSSPPHRLPGLSQQIPQWPCFHVSPLHSDPTAAMTPVLTSPPAAVLGLLLCLRSHLTVTSSQTSSGHLVSLQHPSPLGVSFTTVVPEDGWCT